MRCYQALGVCVGLLLGLSACSNTVSVEASRTVSTPFENRQITPPVFDEARQKRGNGESLPLFELAMTSYSKKEYGKASVLLREASMKSPDSPEARFFLGICYLMTNDTDAAIGELKTASALGKSDYQEDALYFLGEAYARKKDAINASRELDRVIAMNGNNAGRARTLREIVNISAH